MTNQSATPAEPHATFPTGTFTYTIGDASPVVEIHRHGKMILNLEGQVSVTAAYRAIGDVLEVTDEGGPYAIPEFGAGRHTWNRAGNTLTFSTIEETCRSRAKSFAVPWTRVG
jgi:hypothetical protein